jgi:hypothetical protein
MLKHPALKYPTLTNGLANKEAIAIFLGVMAMVRQGDVEGGLANMVGALGTIIATTETKKGIQIKTIMNVNI